ncbi:hypothetical protein EJ02DRAFT_471526 [Clathrospora elynae]|uniref:F-box domain-containing protein n=1 Tax=Clathrospora elynae TaxID=706981 RepID=A0A6A5S4X1_9PLEO|nr:hypothetical protein EJ02DRAFT_471526 [Clathrospora elynae]
MGSFISSRPEQDWKSDARHAMEAGAFCVICGGPFDIEGDVYNIDPKDTRFQWLYHFRLLGSVGDVLNHLVIPGIFLSERASFSMTGSGYFRLSSQTGQEDVWFDTLSYTHDCGTVFPLHEACMTTSCRAIDHHQSMQSDDKRQPALAILIHLLNTRFIGSNTPVDKTNELKNDLFDFCLSSDLYGPRSVMAMTRLEWWGGEYDRFYTNPIDDVGTTLLVQIILQASPHTRVEHHHAFTITREPQRLERFPTELLDAVCKYLPVRSVISLHRTSKALATKIPLDNAFWRNSLRDGGLHPHIWDLDTNLIEQRLLQADLAPLDPTASCDWKAAAQLLATKRFPISGRDARLADVPNGFWNRCRIWATIEEALLGIRSPNTRYGYYEDSSAAE